MTSLYNVTKQIAMSFLIKCNKYSKEQLTSDLCDKLFDESVMEYCTREKINFGEVEEETQI